MQLTLNGFVAGPNGELDWMTWDWDDDLKEYAQALTDSIDTILLGRKMTDGFASHWENVAQNPNDPEVEFARKMVESPKIVFSRTLEEVKWKNAAIARRGLKDEISELKKQGGQDIIVYGGANFVSNLTEAGLIDEYYLFINPVAIQRGMTIFGDINKEIKLSLLEAKKFDCGIVVLHYER
jgi:dihydrofolate reductase